MNIFDAVVFYTNDVDVAVEFYTEKIGLKLEREGDDNYASLLFNNGVKLGIKKATKEREVPGSQTFFLAIEDAELDYRNAKEKGLNIYQELVEEPWALQFSVLDPDGNKIEFLQYK